MDLEQKAIERVRTASQMWRKQLNKKVRHGTREALLHAEYKRVVKTLYEVDFT